MRRAENPNIRWEKLTLAEKQERLDFVGPLPIKGFAFIRTMNAIFPDICEARQARKDSVRLGPVRAAG